MEVTFLNLEEKISALQCVPTNSNDLSSSKADAFYEVCKEFSALLLQSEDNKKKKFAILKNAVENLSPVSDHFLRGAIHWQRKFLKKNEELSQQNSQYW